MISSSKKNILIVLPHLIGKGGVEQYWRNLKPFYDTSEEFNFDYFEIGGNIKDKLHIIKDQQGLKKILENRKFDLVHLNPSLNYKSVVRDGLFIRTIRKQNIPFMITFHGWDPKVEKKLRNYFPFVLRSTFLCAKYITVLSKKFEINILDWGYKNKISIETTCIGNDLLDDFSIKEKIATSKKATRIQILYISRIVKLKGVLETIKAVQLLSAKHNIELNIAGVGPYLKEAKRYVNSHNLSNVKFLGYLQGAEKLNLFYSNQILCFPSIYPEGLPVTIMEAIATGCAVVTTPNAGIKDIFIDGEMGYFCTNSPEDVANKVEEILKLDNLYKIMEFNYKHGNKYSAAFVSTKLLQIYKSIL